MADLAAEIAVVNGLRIARLQTFALLMAIIAASPLLRAAQNPPAARLVEITVVGSQRYTTAEIIRASELELGATVTPAAFQEAANRLSASGAFSEVNYTYAAKPGGVAVEFRVVDGSDFAACTFDNLVWFSEKELRARIKEMVPLFGEKIPLKGDIPAKIEAVMAYLLEEKGIPGTVTIKGAGETSVTALQFSVTGVRLVVGQVEIQGARVVDAATVSGALQPLLATDYDQAFVREFVRQQVGSLYERLGYLRVAFSAPTVELLSGSTQDLMVTVKVAEGDQFRLREIRWEGNEAIPSVELAKLVHVLPGQPADTVQFESDLDEVQGLYETKGYIGARASFKPSFDDAARTVAFDVQIQEGDLYSMGQLEIAGIDPERAEALRKTSELAPGQPYDRSYWNTFISKSSRLLPTSKTTWKASREESVHAETKTVDVTLTFAPDAGQ
jgi:outer membrane protein assembly factor BamA